MSVSGRDERLRVMQAKQKLKAGFLNLPTPRNDFELVDPTDVIEEKTAAAISQEEDAAERDARDASFRAEEESKALARRSQAIKLNLPRPTEVDVVALISALEIAPSKGNLDLEIEREITLEMARLLEHDAILHPVPGGRVPGGGNSSLPFIPDEELDAARDLVRSELATAIGFPGASEEVIARTIKSSVDLAAFEAAWKPSVDQLAFDASSQSLVDKSSLSEEQRVAGLRALVEATKENISREAQAAAKVEAKLGKVLGYLPCSNYSGLPF